LARDILPCINPLNPTAITVIEKSRTAAPAVPRYVCPSFRTGLRQFPDCFFSEASARAYPVIGGIPCLRREFAIIASKYLDYDGPVEPTSHEPIH
jgi:hypothetical protein